MTAVVNPEDFTLEDLEREIEEDEEIDSDEFADSESEEESYSDNEDEDSSAPRIKRQREEEDSDTSEDEDISEDDGEGFQALLDRLDAENEKSKEENEEPSPGALLGTDISCTIFTLYLLAEEES